MAPVAAAVLAALASSSDVGAMQSNVNASGFPATLVMPDGRKKPPAVLMISGSGPTDRDGNSTLGIHAGYLARLADDLSRQGIASLRYDKRGLPGSQPAPREDELTIATFADDAATVLSWLEGRDDVGPIIVLGHSEGGLVALGVASEHPELAGLVLVATLEAGGRTGAVPVPLLGLFRPSVQPFIRSLLALQPAAALGALPQPALVIGGGTDIQVSRADFEALAAARPGIESRWFPKMNHVLVDTVATRWLNVLTYTNTLLPLTEGLTVAIADFVDRSAEAEDVQQTKR